MDLATLLGMVGAIGVVLAAIVTGGSPMVFINVPSILIVVMGTILVVMIKFSLGQFLGAFKVATRAFFFKLQDPAVLIQQIIELATVVRKEGLLALEDNNVENPFLAKGLQLLVDGNSREVVESLLQKEMQLTMDRHKWGAAVFSATGDVAPAMGMIGTLIGLVQMLSAMDDPKSIGPAMAVALLTTLYGAFIANAIAIPIADKLKLRKAEESRINALCMDGVLAIKDGQNPRIIEGMLTAYLAPKQRVKVEE
jgi:chemotaxis protein MotA